ncbi:hypothetical protein [Flavobacterium piscis]|uniref:WD40 repeat domain-containing protein n=1 Tax=Flavobacterium piscis TaxID=1114874 RepID=A0ABU1YCW9_9FLAO|nr:hypothetical protein [Flavobacterium piscis]MDR7212084.1 hypothetical protein [Flavobacterium piscis]
MKTEKYKIIIEGEGLQHVKIFKAEGKGYVNDWNFPLIGDEEPIVFSEFYNETQFIVMNWDGWIRVYDTGTKQLLLDHKLNGKVGARAILSLDKSTLYIAFSIDSGQNYLAQLSLGTFDLKTYELPRIIYKTIQIRNDGNLLFYQHNWKYVGDNKVYTHGYLVLDVNTKNIEEYELPYAPQFSFEIQAPVIDLERNRGIMPWYDVECKTDVLGATVFEYKIVFFDLKTFQLLNILSVRDFTKSQLGSNDYDCEEMEEYFLAAEKNSGYNNALRDFHENLTTIKVVSDGIWLCWRSGILRKINTDQILSPLLVTSSLPNSTITGMFNHAFFYSHLYHIDNSIIVFTDHLNFFKIPLPEFDSEKTETLIALELENTSLDEFYALYYSSEKQKEIEQRDYQQIVANDLPLKQGFVDALLQIETIVLNLNTLGIGPKLSFVIKNAKGDIMYEPEFFAEAINHDPERIKSIIEKFIEYPKIKYVYRNQEETALCHAVYELAKKEDIYFTTVLRYLAAIDLDHDVFNIENVIPLLEKTYTSKILLKKIKPLSKELAELYEDYIEEREE